MSFTEIMQENILNKEIKYLKGIGPKKAELLNKELKIFTFKDLLYYFPYRYIDRSKFYKISEIRGDLPYIQIKAKFLNMRYEGPGNKKRLIALFTDNTGLIELVWFKGLNWITKILKPDIEFIIYGKPTIFNRTINIIHPEIEEYAKYEQNLLSPIQPVYSTTEKLKSKYITTKTIQKYVQELFKSINKLSLIETLPEYIVTEHKLLTLNKALFNIHFPENEQILNKARYRLKFEELFFTQLNILKFKYLREQRFQGYKCPRIGEYFNTFYRENLNFELTDAQKRVIKEIRRDLGSGKQMNRLLQGDVGSGKTLVALMTMLIGLDNAYQTCLMAPTEILANQHFSTLSHFLTGLNVNIQLLTSSTKKSLRNKIFRELISGELQILVGTHALIEETVKFKNLAIVIIDEQHRFGVVQRAKLWKKSSKPPHVLVMTATPIPRTLAMTLYGDLEVSVIDELPPGRRPIKTLHFYETQRTKVYAFLQQQIKKGQQVYIVYPLIEESEKLDYQYLYQGIDIISSVFPSPEYKISVVHGKMKQHEKEQAMQMFLKGETQIMIATTVIEVGVDVPNATIMVIENAERYGLSQLHQLRGRVGRGATQSYCILITAEKISNEAKMRIETMIRTNNGFEISEVDLKLRGPGDMEGTQQSGLPVELKIANLATDGLILEKARKTAKKIILNDPLFQLPANRILKKQIMVMNKEKPNYMFVS